MISDICISAHIGGVIWKCFGPVYSFKLKLLKITNHFENLESNEKGYRNWNTNRGKGLQTKVEKMQMDERGYKQKWNKCKWMKGVTDKNWDGKKMKIVNQNLSDRQQQKWAIEAWAKLCSRLKICGYHLGKIVNREKLILARVQ